MAAFSASGTFAAGIRVVLDIRPPDVDVIDRETPLAGGL
jgi:hypothetical protein